MLPFGRFVPPAAGMPHVTSFMTSSRDNVQIPAPGMTPHFHGAVNPRAVAAAQSTSPQKPKFDFHKLAESALSPSDVDSRELGELSGDVMTLEQLQQAQLIRYNMLMWQAAYASNPQLFHQTHMTYTRRGRNRRYVSVSL